MVDDALDGVVVGDEAEHEGAVEQDPGERGRDDVDVDVGGDLATLDGALRRSRAMTAILGAMNASRNRRRTPGRWTAR